QISEDGGKVKPTIERRLAHDPRSLTLIRSAQAHTLHRQSLLEAKLQMPLEQFAAISYLFRLLFNGPPAKLPAGIPVALTTSLDTLHDHLRFTMTALPMHQVRLIDKLFDDFFKLRDNIYDRNRIATLLAQTTVE